MFLLLVAILIGTPATLGSCGYNAAAGRTISYDPNGLAGATGPWGTGSFDYDSLGNLRKKTLGARVVDIQYNGKNQGKRSGNVALRKAVNL